LQPWAKTLTAFSWPLNAIAAASIPSLRKSKEDIDRESGGKGAGVTFKGKPVADTLEDHVNVFTATVPKLAVGALVWLHLNWSLDGGKRFADLRWNADWVIGIFIRDLIITWATASFCDFFSYDENSPFYEVMKDFKFSRVPVVNDKGKEVGTSPKYTNRDTRQLLGFIPVSQQAHDMFWSTLSTLISSAIEVLVLHRWATDASAVRPAELMTGGSAMAWWLHRATLLWLLSMPYWRLGHFFCVHRFMHKWFTRTSKFWIVRQIPDVGAFVYKHVHALHHLSKHPTAWSGISMHPVESSMYYTAMLVPVIFGAHPIVFYYCKFDLTMAALIGHDGFGFPGGGSQPHWLHHTQVEFNYGENYAPFDWLLGTFAATEDDAYAIVQERNKRAKQLGVKTEEEEHGMRPEDPVGKTD
jgi:sterol desaturase/sphingolipid hydroxylase (fatty acid hydroxylase superfamily)